MIKTRCPVISQSEIKDHTFSKDNCRLHEFKNTSSKRWTDGPGAMSLPKQETPHKQMTQTKIAGYHQNVVHRKVVLSQGITVALG